MPVNPYDSTSPSPHWRDSAPSPPLNTDSSNPQRESVQNYRGKIYREPSVGLETWQGTNNMLRKGSIDGNLPIRTHIRSSSDAWSNVGFRDSTPENVFSGPPAHGTGERAYSSHSGPSHLAGPRNTSHSSQRALSTSGASVNHTFSFDPVSSQSNSPRKAWCLRNGVCTPVLGSAGVEFERNTRVRASSPIRLEPRTSGTFEPRTAEVTRVREQRSERTSRDSSHPRDGDDPDNHEGLRPASQIERSSRPRAIRPERQPSQSHPLGRKLAKEGSDRFR